MSKYKFIVVLFYKDGSRETHNQDCGLAIDLEKCEADYIYIATSKRDADFMIQNRKNKYEETM